jgi:hypothetical protein
MVKKLALALSILALVATFYQLYLQRIHNEKSVKPLVQINLTDHNGLVYVHIQNNGLGPMIIEKLIFTRGDQVYHDITECLSLNPRTYQHVFISASIKKVVPHGTYLEVFSRLFDGNSTKEEIDVVRQELASLRLTVEGKDMYDKKIVVERDLHWFARHAQKQNG